MQTQPRNTDDKNSIIQGVSLSIVDQAATVEGKSSDLSPGEQFSRILDKIAARLNDNLGYDFNALLVSAAPVVRTQPSIKDKQIKENTVKGNLDKSTPEKTERQNTFKATKVEREEKSNSQEAQRNNKERVPENRNPAVREKASAEVKDTRPQNEIQTKDISKLVKSVDTKERPQLIQVKEEAFKDEQTHQNVNKIEFSAKHVKSIKVTSKTEQNSKVEKQINPLPAESKTTEQISEEQTVDTFREFNLAAQVTSEKPEKQGLQKATHELQQSLATMMLGSYFTKNVEAAGVRAAPMTAEAGKIISELAASKVGSAVNSNSTSGGQNLSGGLMFKGPAEKFENVKERTFRQQPQMLKAFEKVESALKEAAKARDGKTISLRLDPPNLGSVKVDVSMREGRLHARIQVDSQTVSQMLRDGSHELLTALRKLGINIERVSVAINHGGFEQNFESDNYVGGNQEQTTGSEEKSSEKNNGDNVFKNGAGKQAAAQSEENVYYDHWIA